MMLGHSLWYSSVTCLVLLLCVCVVVHGFLGGRGAASCSGWNRFLVGIGLVVAVVFVLRMGCTVSLTFSRVVFCSLLPNFFLAHLSAISNASRQFVRWMSFNFLVSCCRLSR